MNAKNVNTSHLMVFTIVIIGIITVLVVLTLIKKKKVKNIRKTIENFDREKNIISSAPIMAELSKVEAIVKNNKMEDRIINWKSRYSIIQEEKINNINNLIIELEVLLNNKEYKKIDEVITKTELEISKVKESVNSLLEEIKEITSSDEKYRDIVTKLKSRYRDLYKFFDINKSSYLEVADVIEMQFENIERRFSDFEDVMENNEYTEVVHIVKALDTMIEHIGIVINEVPNLITMTNKMIPKKLEEIEQIYEDMLGKGYGLSYLKIEYNIEETKKRISNVVDRIKVLNLEDCLFEINTVLDYLDNIFNEFEKEKICKKLYEDMIDDFGIKLRKTNRMVRDIYQQMDDIKKMYDLKDKDLKKLKDVSSNLEKLNSDYEKLLTDVARHEDSYSKLGVRLETLTKNIIELDDDFDVSIKSLGSMYDDELRAKEQLKEIQLLLDKCKINIRSYKLPVINNSYFVELEDANYAIEEIKKELDKKPITIKVLNTRVDTGRDLVLKLYNTVNDMIKTAFMAEKSIVYGNRYRSNTSDIDYSLTNAELLFYRGKYKESLKVSVDSIESIESGFKKKIEKELNNINIM